MGSFRPTIAVLALITASSPAHAVTAQEICSAHGENAELVMQLKYAGLKLSEALAMVEKTGAGAVARAIVFLAYESPNYSSEEARKEQVKEFVQRVELACFKKWAE